MGLDLSQYMGAYIDGSRENLDTMDKMLLSMEQNPENLEAIKEIFRAAHTLKGMSATMGFEKVAHLTHEMESVLDKLQTKQVAVSAGIIDIIFETFDVLRILVNDSIAQTNSNVDLDGISAKLEAIIGGHAAAAGGGGGHDHAGAGAAAAAAPPEDSGNLDAAGAQFFVDMAEFAVSEFEASGFIDAQQSGANPFLLRVNLVSDCLLKGPRIFMVLRTLDTFHCEIKKSIPEVKDLESENFEYSFKMLISTDKTSPELKAAIESISEIETAEVIPLRIEDLCAGMAVAAPRPAAPPPPPPPAPVYAPAPPQVQQTAAPQAPQPVAHAPASAPVPAVPAAPAGFVPVQQLPGAQVPAPGVEAEGEEKEKGSENIELVHLVTFEMIGEIYALEITQVEGIINLIPITRLPKAPVHFEGIINMRGEIVPVINLRRRLKLVEKVRESKDQIIILTFENEKVKVGFLVDKVHEVLRLPKTSVEAPSRVSDSVDVEYLNGVGKMKVEDTSQPGAKGEKKTKDQIVILLNAPRIVFG